MTLIRIIGAASLLLQSAFSLREAAVRADDYLSASVSVHQGRRLQPAAFEEVNATPQEIIDYLGSKAGEILHVREDLLLARASWQAQFLSSGKEEAFVAVSEIHALHPVGGWREDTWAKTIKRRDAILKAKTLIVSKDVTLLDDDMNNNEDLAPMNSITNFIAVPFPYCGYKYVLLEGNGRLKAMQLAALEHPELQGLKVQTAVLQYSPDSLRTTQEGIALLWNQYVEEASKMEDRTLPSARTTRSSASA